MGDVFSSYEYEVSSTTSAYSYLMKPESLDLACGVFTELVNYGVHDIYVFEKHIYDHEQVSECKTSCTKPVVLLSSQKYFEIESKCKVPSAELCLIRFIFDKVADKGFMNRENFADYYITLYPDVDKDQLSRSADAAFSRIAKKNHAFIDIEEFLSFYYSLKNL